MHPALSARQTPVSRSAVSLLGALAAFVCLATVITLSRTSSTEDIAEMVKYSSGRGTWRPRRLEDGHDTMFVSVAAFRDEECAPTVLDMFQKAQYPFRLFVGIVEQREDSDPLCLPDSHFGGCSESGHHDSFCPRDNIRIRRVTPTEAKGPTFGRYVAMLMYRGEKYFMMIDSHNRFIPHWDSNIIDQHRNAVKRSAYGKAVLSHYPSAYMQGIDVKRHTGSTTVMCSARFMKEDKGYLRFEGATFPSSAFPRHQPFAAAGFLFSDGFLVQDVPFDPNLDFLFDGEEVLYSARMWTHGWDLFAPAENIMFHFYGRPEAPKVWSVKDNRWWFHQKVSIQRVQYMLNVTKEGTDEPTITPRALAIEPRIEKEFDRYGLGSNRTLRDYWKFAQVDPIKRTVGTFCSKARKDGRTL